jgi:hypothetical protein
MEIIHDILINLLSDAIWALGGLLVVELNRKDWLLTNPLFF